MISKATTVAEYLAQLPPERRAAIEAVRRVILDNLDSDYAEAMSYGMIGYAVPHSIFPQGYHCDPKQPLPFAGLASQKQHMSVYLMCIYGHAEHEKWLRQSWAKTGKKLDMGKSCIRFKNLDDLALDVIGAAVRRVPAKAYIAQYLAALSPKGKPKSTTPAKAASPKPSAPKAKAPAKKKTTKAAVKPKAKPAAKR